jgi:CrcB protein
MSGEGTTLLAALVAIVAGGVASVVRYSISLVFARRGPLRWAVLIVNVVGSALGGAVLGLAQSGAISADLRLVVLGGVAGGLTTFSTWSVETIDLALAGKWRSAALNVGLNLLIGISVATGAWLLVK